MVSMGLQVVALCLAIVGLLGTLAATIIPHWQVTAHGGTSVITATGQMRGLWMDCVWKSTGSFQCRPFYSILSIRPALKAAQALMVISCVLSAVGLGVATAGVKCTLLLGPSRSRSKRLAAVTSGLCLVAAGLCTLVPVAWNTHDTVRQFHDPWHPNPTKYDLGAAIYLGYAASILTSTAGAMLALSCCETPAGRRGAAPPSIDARSAGRGGHPRARVGGGPPSAPRGGSGLRTDISWVARPSPSFVAERRDGSAQSSVTLTVAAKTDRGSAKTRGEAGWRACAPPDYGQKGAEKLEAGVAVVGRRWSPPSSAGQGTGPLVIQNRYALTNL